MRRQLTKVQLEQLIEKALHSGNPYIEVSTEFAVDGANRYIYLDGKIYTKEQLDSEYRESAKKDIQSGYRDRLVGYYDKWYRYNKMDCGYAYDLGVKAATENPKCADDMRIIEVIEAVG